MLELVCLWGVAAVYVLIVLPCVLCDDAETAHALAVFDPVQLLGFVFGCCYVKPHAMFRHDQACKASCTLGQGWTELQEAEVLKVKEATAWQLEE